MWDSVQYVKLLLLFCFSILCFLLQKPWKLRLNPCHCHLSSRSSLFLYLYCGRFCLRSAATCFFFSMNVNHHARPAKAVSAVTDAAFTALSFRMARNTSLTAEDVHDPAAVRSSDSSIIGCFFNGLWLKSHDESLLFSSFSIVFSVNE